MRRDHSIIACSRHVHMGVVLRAHPVRGESHIQRNTVKRQVPSGAKSQTRPFPNHHQLFSTYDQAPQSAHSDVTSL